MKTFLAVTDDILSQRIEAATRRVVFVAPAISISVATAIEHRLERTEKIPVTVLLDPNEDGYRIGYGDREGLEHMQSILAKKYPLTLRSHPGCG